MLIPFAELASNPTAPPEILLTLIENARSSRQFFILVDIAANPNITRDIVMLVMQTAIHGLHDLSTSVSESMQCQILTALSGNPSLPLLFLEYPSLIHEIATVGQYRGQLFTLTNQYLRRALFPDFKVLKFTKLLRFLRREVYRGECYSETDRAFLEAFVVQWPTLITIGGTNQIFTFEWFRDNPRASKDLYYTQAYCIRVYYCDKGLTVLKDIGVNSKFAQKYLNLEYSFEYLESLADNNFESAVLPDLKECFKR